MPSKTIFVHATNHVIVDVENIGKEIPKEKSRYTVRKFDVLKPKSRKIPICWTCGVKGHTYHDCWDYDYCFEDDSYYTPRKTSKTFLQKKNTETYKNSEIFGFKSRRTPVCWTCGVRGHTYHDCCDDYQYVYDTSNAPSYASTFSSRPKRKYNNKKKNSSYVNASKEIDKPKQIWVRKDIVKVFGSLTDYDLSSLSTVLNMSKNISTSNEIGNQSATIK